MVEQRAAIGRLAASNYANGDPALMGLSVMLNSQDPAEVTSQMNTVDSLMSRQTTLLDDLQARPRRRWCAEEAKVEKAKDAVAVQRQAARAEPGPQAGARAAPPRRPVPRSPRSSRATRAAQVAAARARAADLRPAAHAEEAGGRGSAS